MGRGGAKPPPSVPPPVPTPMISILSGKGWGGGGGVVGSVDILVICTDFYCDLNSDPT